MVFGYRSHARCLGGLIVVICCVDYSAIGVDEIVLWELFLGY